MSIKIVHLTSVHSRYDVRIFQKECRTLAQAGYEVCLVVADGKGDETKDGIKIYDVGLPGSRIKRMIWAPRAILQRVKELKPQIAHLHDPELMLVGARLAGKGVKVVFDSHEDVPGSIEDKEYIPRALRRTVSLTYSVLEKLLLRKYSAVVTATPAIARIISRKIQTKKVIDINNFPLENEIILAKGSKVRQEAAVYVGGVTKIRGLEQVVQSLEISKKTLWLVGPIQPPAFGERLRGLGGWRYVDERGALPRGEAISAMHNALAGIVTFLPAKNHVEAQPNKMFEYMAAGVAVIASDFPLWKSIVEENDCGVCVDPLNPNEIAAAMRELLDNPRRAKEMGRNGIAAVRQKYNWAKESQKLLALYEELAG